MTKPYYNDSKYGITIYCGDCCDIIPSLDIENITVTDPPYNLGIKYGEKYNDNNLDYLQWCQKWLCLIEKHAKTIAISCGTTNLTMWAIIKDLVWILCWHKPFSVGMGAFGFSNWEPILIYGKTGIHGRRSDYFSATFIPYKGQIDHPCPKPIRWAEQIITITSELSDVILDPFMGSGTTLVAAKKLGHKAIGIEIEEKYCEIAVKRLQKEGLGFNFPRPTINLGLVKNKNRKGEKNGQIKVS